jgi:uncharacterized protein
VQPDQPWQSPPDGVAWGPPHPAPSPPVPLPPAAPARRPRAPWGFRDVVLVIVVGFVFAVWFTLVTASLATIAVRAVDRSLSAAAWFALAGTTIYAGFAVAVWALIVERRRVSWTALGFRRVSGWLLAAMVPTGVGLLIANVLILLPLTFFLGLGDPDASSNDEVLSPEAGLSGGELLLIALPLVIGAPLVEELLFRGVLYRYLRGGLGVIVAVLLSAIIFAVLHVVIPPLFVMGVVLAVLTQRTDSLLPGIVLHATNNALVVLGLWAATSVE